MASFFENLFDFSDPARAARVRGGLIGAGQAISRPYGNIGSAMAGAAAGAEDARQNYSQQQYQDLRMKALQAELTKDERKRNALNELMRGFGKSQQPAQPAFTPARQMQAGLATGAPMQDENGADIPQPMQEMAQQQPGGFKLPEGYTPESFSALAAVDEDAAIKLLTAPPEIKAYRPGDRIYRNGVEIAAIPDNNTAPKTTGGMYWNEQAKAFQPIAGYEDQARRIAAAGRAPAAAGDGYRIMTPDEKKAAGLPTDGTYQVSRSGKIDRVAGNNATRQVPSMALAGMTANRNTLGKIDKAIAALKTEQGKSSVGYMYGFSDAANQRFDPEGVKVRAYISDIGSQKLHDRSGASVTISEAPRLQPFVPSVADTPEALLSKLENLKAEYQANVDEADSFYSPEAGYMRLPEQRTAPPPPAPKTPPPAAIQQLKMMGQKGAAQFDAVFGKGAAAKYLGGK